MFIRALKWLIIVLLAVVIVAAIVQFIIGPPYADSTPRAQVADALLVANEHRTALATACSEGELRAGMANEDLGLRNPAAYNGKYVDSVSASTDSDHTARVEIVLRALYEDTHFFRTEAAEAGKTLIYEFRCEEDGGMNWKVVGGTLPQEYRPRY